MSVSEQLRVCAEASAMLERKVAEQERIIDNQCDTIIDLVNTLDARDVQ